MEAILKKWKFYMIAPQGHFYMHSLPLAKQDCFKNTLWYFSSSGQKFLFCFLHVEWIAKGWVKMITNTVLGSQWLWKGTHGNGLLFSGESRQVAQALQLGTPEFILSSIQPNHHRGTSFFLRWRRAWRHGVRQELPASVHSVRAALAIIGEQWKGNMGDWCASDFQIGSFQFASTYSRISIGWKIKMNEWCFCCLLEKLQDPFLLPSLPVPSPTPQ